MVTQNILVKQLETVTHAARMRRMTELGRAAATDAQIAQTLTALENGGFYERCLALQSCFGSKDGGHALRAIEDPSSIIQNRALKLLALFGNEAQITKALHDARPDRRLSLLGLLRNGPHAATVDSFLNTLADRDAVALGPLLSFGSAQVVARHFELVRPTGGIYFWRRLARFHPDLVLDRLRASFDAAAILDARLLWEANTVLEILAKRHPDQGVKLAQLLAPHGPIHASALSRLGQRRPAAIADLVLASEGPQNVSLASAAHRLDNCRLLSLLERQPNTLTPPQVWFRRLPRDQREAVFLHSGLQWRDKDGCVDGQLLRHLPAKARETEGRRHLELPVLATRPLVRLQYAALVPWAEARRAVDPFLNHPEAELRSAAMQALIGVARFDRPRLAEVLTLVRGRKHEQDPVRGVMLTALAQLPPGIWKADHLDDLGQVLRDALSAADLSHMTVAFAQEIVVRLLPFHPDWSAEWLATLVRERGQIHLGFLEQLLTDADVRRIAPALTPVLKAWQTREREGQLVQLGQCLGRRIRAFDALLEIFRRMLRETRTQWVAAAIVQIIAQHQRKELKELAPALVAEDPSWITQMPVLTFLHRHRQDLLTAFLGQKAYRGRFSTGRTRYVLPLRDGFFRWTTAQQSIFAKTLEEVTHVKDRMRDIPAVLGAITQLAALPAVEPTRLAELAADERPAVQEAALRALGKLDAGQGVPILVQGLQGDRARVAIYALRKAILAMPIAPALELLKTVPLTRITVAKEYLRLLGDMPAVEAFNELQKLDARELHRDVRVALLRALWGHLEQPDAWAILDRAAESPDPALMTAVVRIPADRLSETSQRRLVALLARLLTHPEPSVRVQVLQRCTVLPVTDREQLTLPRFLACLDTRFPDERDGAAAALFATSRPEDAPGIVQGLRTILANRRAILAGVRALETAVWRYRTRLVPIARRVLDLLAEEPVTLFLRVELAGRVSTWSEFADLVERLVAAGELHVDVLGAAVGAIRGWIERPDRADLEPLESRLAASADAPLRRLALAALIAQADLPGGWNEARLQRLRSYRQDRAILVAAAAQFTFPVTEI